MSQRDDVPTKVTITRKLRAPAGRVWDAIAGIGRLDVWFPSISSCRVEGEGPGARRYLTLDGEMGNMLDHILNIEPDVRRFTYQRVESPFPVTSYLGTVEVFSSYDDLGVVAWTVDFDSLPDMSEPVASLLEGAIGAGVQGMDIDLSEPGPD